MAELVWTMEAVRCLEEIREYIIHDNPTAAQSVVSGLYTKVQSLKEQILEEAIKGDDVVQHGEDGLCFVCNKPGDFLEGVLPVSRQSSS